MKNVIKAFEMTLLLLIEKSKRGIDGIDFDELSSFIKYLNASILDKDISFSCPLNLEDVYRDIISCVYYKGEGLVALNGDRIVCGPRLLNDFKTYEVSSFSILFELDLLVKEYLNVQDNKASDSIAPFDLSTLSPKKEECAYDISSSLCDFVMQNYIKDQIEKGLWPKQCKNYSRYILDFDLANIIEIPSIAPSISGFFHQSSQAFGRMLETKDSFIIENNLNNCKSNIFFFNLVMPFSELEKFFRFPFRLQIRDNIADVLTTSSFQRPTFYDETGEIHYDKAAVKLLCKKIISKNIK
ncbi:MAG: hypothetical protein RSE91_04035 [Bacilli bacterium]